jgi:hypothetical protein
MRMLLPIFVCLAVTPAIAAEALRLPAAGPGGSISVDTAIRR